MMQAPERSAERDAALDAVLAQVPQLGWTMAALRAGLEASGGDPLDAELLFPGGVPDMIEAFIDLIDRRVAEAAARTDLTVLRIPARVRAVILLRLEQHSEHREAIRRAAAVLANPCHARLAARCAARTADAIWYAAGDRTSDFSWYTKRATVAAVYGATLLFWLRDMDGDDTATRAFLDRRLAGVARVHKFRKRVQAALERMLPGEAAA